MITPDNPGVHHDVARYKCDTCGAMFDGTHMLTAKNPFDENDMIYGCPSCAAVNDFTHLCDVADCPNPATGGHSTPEGYLFHCHEHWNKGAP